MVRGQQPFVFSVQCFYQEAQLAYDQVLAALHWIFLTCVSVG